MGPNSVQSRPVSAFQIVKTAIIHKQSQGPTMASTVPVPACPGSASYPGAVCTTTIRTMSPEIVEPDCAMELDTITAMNGGTRFGGPELLPPRVVQLPPRLGGFGLNEFVKPLKLAGAEPRLNEFNLSHCAPQKVTRLPTTALRSPMAKAPPVTP